MMVACRLMTVGESGVSSAGFSVARSCFERCGWRFAGALDDELDAASAIVHGRRAHVASRDVKCNSGVIASCSANAQNRTPMRHTVGGADIGVISQFGLLFSCATERFVRMGCECPASECLQRFNQSERPTSQGRSVGGGTSRSVLPTCTAEKCVPTPQGSALRFRTLAPCCHFG